MRKRVIESHSATYLDAIAFRAGDPIVLSGKIDVWDGHRWLWATGPDGKAGWVPDSFVASGHGKTCAARDYSAAELTCRAGEILTASAEVHGWAWCRSDSGRQGWVPLRNLSPLEPEWPSGDG